jgi:hypothetical protein
LVTAQALADYNVALDNGILVLIFPSMAICIGITAMSYKKRNRFRQNDCDRDDLGW